MRPDLFRSPSVGPENSAGSHLPAEAGSGQIRERVAAHLQAFGLRADKSFGQHFLISQRVLDQILHASARFGGVMEVGPGPGILTQGLGAHAEVVALEMDDRMVAAAQAFAPTAQIRQQDALTADWLSVLRELPQPTGIVSNMPYNITGPLLTRVAACRQAISGAVLMMQREVGDKILSGAGKRERGSLSVELQAKFEIKRLCLVPPGSFLPPPKVESIVLDLTPRSDIDPAWDEPAMLSFLRQGFQQPRKTLFNNLRGVAEAAKVRDAMMKEGLTETVRPHELETDAWLRLHQSIRTG